MRWHTVEGPFVLKHKNRYYEMLSGGNWQQPTYSVSYAVTHDVRTVDEWEQAADGWYVIFAVAENQSRFLPKTGDAVCIDVGLENFATLSTGEVIENPRHLKAAERQLKTAQRLSAQDLALAYP